MSSFIAVSLLPETELKLATGGSATPSHDYPITRPVRVVFRSKSSDTEGGLVKYHIEKQDNGITIHIDDIGGKEQKVLEVIRQCRRQSAWACPSAECQNIETMEERAGDGSVFLTLTPRPGTQLNLAGIEECLRYTLHQATKV